MKTLPFFHTATLLVLSAAVPIAVFAQPIGVAAQAAGPAVTGPVFTIDFTNPGLAPSHWSLTLHPDGSGHFTSEKVAAPTDHSGELGLPAVDRDIELTPKFAASIFETAQRHAWFNQDCESHMKVAFQGEKKLSFSGPQGSGSCSYNYSKDKEIQALGDSLLAVSTTILEGAKLEILLQHDPLGLDKEMGFLVAAAKENRAQQLCAIREILARLAQDDHVMEMVRKQAHVLLAEADS
jgi:hypothetical protein